MSLWRKTRSEMAGAYRSLRYDLGKPEPGRTGPVPGADGPDVTSTGMSTFGGVALGAFGGTGPGAGSIRPPRRVLAATSFAVLAVAGAAGSYLAVVNGLGALLGVDPRPDPFPLAATVPQDAAAVSGLGSGTTPQVAGAPMAPVPAGTVTVTAVPGTAAGGLVAPPVVPGAPVTVTATTTATPPPATTPGRTTAPQPGESPCDCPAPPVPTPTDPRGPGLPGQPSGPDSPVPTATPSPVPSPDESGSAPAATEPSGSAGESPSSRRITRHRD